MAKTTASVLFTAVMASILVFSLAKSIITPLNVIEIDDRNYCSEGNGTREKFLTLRISNNAGSPPVNFTQGSIELLLATLIPNESYSQVNSTLSILKFGNVIESVNLPLGNLTESQESIYNTPFFIPGGAVSGEAQIKFEAFNDDYENILCFILDAIIYEKNATQINDL